MTTSPPSLTSSEASSSTAPAAVSGIHQKNGWNLDAPAFTPVLSFPTLAYADQHHYDVGPSRRGGYGRNRFRGGLAQENQRSHHKWKGSYSAQEYGGGAHHQEANSTYRQRVLRRGESDEPHMQDALDPPSFHSQISPHLSDVDYERSDVHSLAESLAASTIFTDEESSASYVESLRTQSSMESGRPWNRGGNDGSKPGVIRTQTTVNSEERRLEQRQKQIDFGKNTLGYQRYVEAIPRHKRKRTDPQTPNKYSKCSKRCWDGLIRHWRRKLHEWDPPELKDQAHRDDELYEANDLNANTDGPNENMKRSSVSRNLFPSAGMPSDGSSTNEAALLPSQTSRRWKGDLDDDVISELDQKYARRLRPLETFEGFGSKSSKRDTESYWPAADVTTGTLDNKFGHRFLLSESVELGGFQEVDTVALPFRPANIRSNLFPPPLSTPATSIQRLNTGTPSFDYSMGPPPGMDPIPRSPSVSSLGTPNNRTPYSDQLQGKGSPGSLYEEDDSVQVIFDPTGSSAVPSLVSSSTVSRTGSPLKNVAAARDAGAWLPSNSPLKPSPSRQASFDRSHLSMESRIW